MKVAAVTGLAAEARILHRLGLAAAVSAGDAAVTEAMASRLIAAGADALMSFGIAGALDPALAPGTLLLPRRVIAEDGASFDVDAPWRASVRARLHARGLMFVEDDLVGAAQVAATANEKAGLRCRTGAAAVDLESGVAAAAARRLARPFLVLRAIADPADFRLPRAALVGLDKEGRAAVLPVLRALIAAPHELPSLMRLALHTRRALAALKRAAPEFRRD